MKSAITQQLRGVLIAGLLAAAIGTAGSQTQDVATRYRLAQGFEQSGEYERAAQLYEELYQKDPGNIMLFDGLQRMLVQLKRYDEAIALLRSRLAQNPADLNLRNTLAGVYQRGGMEQQAREEWDRAIALDPTNPNYYRVVASSMIEHRLLEKAAEVYRRGRKAVNDPILFALELAQLEAVMMDYIGASTELIGWLRKNPSQLAFVQSRLASFVAKPDGREAAINVVRQAIRSEDEVRLHELLGWLYLEGREFGEAFGEYQTIDGLTRAQGGALLQFADRAFREQAFEIAAHAYQEAIRVPLSPNKMPNARYGYANALRELAARSDTLHRPMEVVVRGEPGARSRYSNAFAAYQGIIRDFPKTEYSAKAYYQIGTIQFQNLFDLDGALESFNKVVDEAGSIRLIRYGVALKEGEIYLAKGDTTRAREQYASVERASDATPDQNDEAVFRLAELDFFAGRSDDAIRRLDSITVNLKADYANDALQLQAFLQENLAMAHTALVRYGQAELFARQRQNTEAIALFQDIVRQYPRSLLVDDALMHSATLQVEAGLYTEAITTYRRLLTEFKETSIALDRAQFGLAETYEFGLRDKTKAIAEYEKLLADHPRSVFTEVARKRIRRLRGDPL
jgi:tetratricopeptide (TPR) repeat protein